MDEIKPAHHKGQGDSARPATGYRRWGLALQVVVIYLVVASLWILLSGHIALSLTDTPESLAYIETLKGMGFVVLSALVIFALIYRGQDRQYTIETELQQQKQLLAGLVNNLPGIIYRCRYDADWTMEFIAGAVKRITGYDSDEILHNRVITFDQMTLESDRGYVRRQVDEMVEKGQPYMIEYRIRHKNGEVRWIYEQGRALRNDAGEIEQLEGFLQDVTDEHTARRELRDMAERLQLFMEALPDCMFIMLDADGYIQCWNNNAYRLHGFTEAEVLGRHLTTLYPAADASQQLPEQALAQARQNGIHHDSGQRARKDGSHFQASVVITALWHEDGSLRGYGYFLRRREND